MPRLAIVDAGPVVAYLRSKEEHHAWAVEQFHQFTSFATCDAVLAEVCARLACYREAQWPVIELLHSKALTVNFDSNAAADRLLRLMKKYADQPMDFADACLVLMTEKVDDSVIVTLDTHDFEVYRRHEREVIPFESPDR
jgi:uncharacterized protein